MAALTTYLFFDGNCREAFEFYKLAFGSEFAQISKYSEGPAHPGISKEEGDKIMHVALPIGTNAVLMGSDRPKSTGKLIVGNNFSISINTTSEEETTKLFNALSKDGNITMPLQKTFWNAYYGMLIDKFGIAWMVNYDYGQRK